MSQLVTKNVTCIKTSTSSIQYLEYKNKNIHTKILGSISDRCSTEPFKIHAEQIRNRRSTKRIDRLPLPGTTRRGIKSEMLDT